MAPALDRPGHHRRLRHRYCRVCHPDTAAPARSLCGVRYDLALRAPLHTDPLPDCVVCVDLTENVGCDNGHGPWPNTEEET